MAYLNDQGLIAASKKDDGNMKVRIDANEFAYKDGCLFAGVKSKLEIQDIYIPDSGKFEFPGVVSVKLDDSKPSQKFLKMQLEKLDSGKVYKGFISVDDKLELYAKALEDSNVATILESQACSLAINESPEIIRIGELKAPASYSGKKASYNPLAKYEALKQMLGSEAGENLVELAAFIDALGEGKDTLLKLIEACL